MRAWVPAALLLGIAPVWSQTQELATGRFLVADRSLGDPNFAQTVILLVHYSEDDGTVGLIVNRRTDLPLSRVFRDVKGAKGRTDPAYMGGPVEPGGVLALLKSATKPEEANRVFGDVFLISSRALLEKSLAGNVEASAFHVYLGYAGWGPGQLEHEMQLGAWHVLPPDSGVVFDPDPDEVWGRMIRKTELRIAKYSDSETQAGCPMSLTFPKNGNSAEFCGADPRVCAGPLDPLSILENQLVADPRRPARGPAADPGVRPTF